MRPMSLLMVFVCTLFCLQVTSQNSIDIDDLLERQNKNHMGSIYDVFTQNELLLLKDYYKNQDISPTSTKSVGDFIFSTEDQTSVFGKFGIANPNIFEPIAPSSALDFEGAGAYDILSDTFLVFDSANNIWEVDPITGEYWFVENVSPPSGETFVGLEFNPQDGRLYALSTDGVKTTLSEVDEDTWQITPVGETGLTLGIALGISLGGIAYSYDIDDDNLYSLSLSTGNKTLIGSIGFNANFGQGLSRDSATGNLYMIAFNNAGLDAQLRMVNTNTGNTTLVGSIIPGELSHFGWGSLQQPLMGLEDNESVGFSLYPNPAGNFIHVDALQNITGISIYDMQGKRVFQQHIDAKNATIDISSLATGQYVCSAIVNNQRGLYKFVKR